MTDNDLLGWIIQNYQTFLLVLIRLSIVLFMLPIFSMKVIPNLVKVIICVSFSIFLTMYYPINVNNFPLNTFDFFLYLVIEFFIGLVLSLIIRTIYAGLQLSAQIAGFQMGLSMANIIDPTTGTQSVVINEFIYVISILLFFSTYGHHILIVNVFESFKILKPGYLYLHPDLFTLTITTFKEMFILAVKLMAPIIVILFFINVGFGILAKTAPQLNILVISFGINILVGLLFLGFTLDVFWPVFAKYLDRSIKAFPAIYELLAIK